MRHGSVHLTVQELHRNEGRHGQAIAAAGLALWIACFGTSGVHAGSAEPDPETSPSAHGYKLEVIYDGDAFATVHGGVQRGVGYGGLLNVGIEHTFAHRGGADLMAYADLQWIHGGQPSGYAGDAQGVSNLAAAPNAGIEEAWLQANFARVSILGGLYDLNSEFYRLETASLFMNASFGVGPEFAQSGVAGPSIYPRTSAALRLDVKPTDHLVLRGAVLDGVPFRRDHTYALFDGGDGALLVAEAAWLARPPTAARPYHRRFQIGRQSGLGDYDSKIAIGAWHYTASLPDLSEIGVDGRPTAHHASGAYLIADTSVLRDATGSSRASMFLQLGTADPRVDRFGSYAGLGVRWKGLAPGQDQDEIGFALAHARNGSHYQRTLAQQVPGAARAETALELTYLLPVGKHLAVQPDLQYVVHPNTDPTLRNALVVQLHFEIAF